MEMQLEKPSSDLEEARAHGDLTLISTWMEMVDVVHYLMGNKKSALSVGIVGERSNLSGTAFRDSDPGSIKHVGNQA